MSLYTALTQVLAPYAARLNGLLTGYDGTVYSTPGEAVRTQINDLHVLIGNEPGIAINASSIVYGEDSNVEDELDGLKERLSDLEQSGGSGAGIPAEVRQAIYTILTNSVYNGTGLTDEKAVIQSWAMEITEITLNKSSESITGAGTSQLTAVTVPAGGLITWSSSNPAVATVSSAGLVTGVSNGTTRIMASCGGKKATCDVIVSGFATLIGITATYTQSNPVYNTSTLDDIKSDLVVTASYDNSTTATVTDYTLSGSLAIGTNTITVSYGGFTDTFTVTVTENLGTLLYSWDFTNNNLTDSVNGIVAATTGTQGANGIAINAAAKYIVLNPSTIMSLVGKRVEIDVASMSDVSTVSAHARLFGVTTETSYNTGVNADVFLRKRTGEWTIYNGSWGSESISASTYNGSYFSGKTVVLEFDSSGHLTVSVDGTDLVTFTGTFSRTGYLVIGSSENDYLFKLSPTISAVRIYEVA